ncbi:MAG: hypothetical protein OXI57_11165 [Rhodospirillales bacterium]|nr:hypothetical protein [Rhodospirillales bacterium]
MQELVSHENSCEPVVPVRERAAGKRCLRPASRLFALRVPADVHSRARGRSSAAGVIRTLQKLNLDHAGGILQGIERRADPHPQVHRQGQIYRLDGIGDYRSLAGCGGVDYANRGSNRESADHIIDAGLREIGRDGIAARTIRKPAIADPRIAAPTSIT